MKIVKNRHSALSETRALNLVYIILGGNIGDVRTTLCEASAQIRHHVGFIQRISSSYQTAAWGNTDQPDFINVAAIVATPLSANVCLKRFLEIEKSLGRIRQEKWGARTIDIDILYFNDEIIKTPKLIIPHPELAHRKFVLIPLCEIAPSYIHPVLRLSNLELLGRLKDDLDVRQI